MSHFDTVIVVDWAAGKRGPVKPAKDQIWIGVATAQGGGEPVYCRSRHIAEAWLKERMASELAEGRRALIGFDFPFAYPKGFGAALTGTDDPFAVWRWYAKRVTDQETGENNRFEIAAGINRRMGGTGPFWGCPQSLHLDGLSPRKDGNDFAGLPEWRSMEAEVNGLSSVWQLAYNGAVGSQVIMGMPVLHRLREAFGKAVSVWPFETTGTPLVLAEIWPSLLNDQVRAASGESTIRDAVQVDLLSRALAALRAEEMADLFAAGDPAQGGILGASHVPLLKTRLAGRTLSPPPLNDDCFALPPGVAWQPVDDALDLLRQRLRPVAGSDEVALKNLCGRILAETVTARRANPPLPNTAVDGFGFAHASLSAPPHTLPLVQGRAAAGAPFGAVVPPGHAIRVLTGARLPDGVDTVVLDEDTRSDGANVAFNGPVKAGANTRKAGEDVQAGDRILPAGRRVTPADIALISATGSSTATVFTPLRVGVLSTGDEVVEPGSTARPDQIFDANRPMLLALLQSWGMDTVDLRRVQDDRAALAEKLDQGAAQCDAILTSGGASAGDEDHVSAVLRETGSLAAWRIALKPGRPLALGMWRGTPVFGLPGNPVAALVCTLVFARPALGLLGGEGWRQPQGVRVPAAFSKAKKPGRREFLRARLRNGAAEVFKSEGSGRISGLSWAEGLVELPDGAADIAPGTPVKYIPFPEF